MSYSPNLAKYDPRFMTYNMNEASLAKFRAAWAKQRNLEGFAHILCLGDSITGAGGVSGNLHTNTWPGRLRSTLDAKTGVPVGTGIVEAQIPLTNNTGQPLEKTAGSTYPYAVGSGLTGFAVGGISGIDYINAAGGTATYGFQTVGANATIKLWCFNYGGGFTSTSVSLDSVAQTAITKGATPNDTIFSASYAVAAAGNHTVVLTSTGSMYLIGFEVIENVTSGVKVTNAGASGRQATAVPTAPLGFYLPDLTIIALGTNDMIQGHTPATFQSDMQLIITGAKAYGDVVCVVPPTDGTSGTTTALMNSFRNVLYALADSNNIAVIDLNKRLLAYSTGLLADGVGHLTNRGAIDFGGAVAALLGQAVLI